MMPWKGVLPPDQIDEQSAKLKEMDKQEGLRRERKALEYEFKTLLTNMLSEKTKKLVPNKDEHVARFQAYQDDFQNMTDPEEINVLVERLRDEAEAIMNKIKFDKGYNEQRKAFEILKKKFDEDDLPEELQVKWRRVESLLDEEHDQSQQNLDEATELRKELVKSTKGM